MDTYEQKNLFTSSGNTVSVTAFSAKDAFGCCSSYAACSDAKVCLIADRDHSINCLYRRNLEQGHIFYGKNADNFNAALYQSFVDSYHAFPESIAEMLRSILYYAFFTKRCIKLIMLADSPEIPALDRAGFVSQVWYPEKVVRKCSMSAMIDACGNLIETANEWAKSQTEPDKWNKRKNVRKELPGIKIKREELSNWIIRFSPETAQKLSEGITFVQLDLNKTLELEEIFKDFIYNKGAIPHPLDTLESGPRFLSQ